MIPSYWIKFKVFFHHRDFRSQNSVSICLATIPTRKPIQNLFILRRLLLCAEKKSPFTLATWWQIGWSDLALLLFSKCIFLRVQYQNTVNFTGTLKINIIFWKFANTFLLFQRTIAKKKIIQKLKKIAKILFELVKG